MPHISGGKDAWHAGLQQKRVAFRLPVPRPAPIANQVLPGVDESNLVPLDEIRNEAGARNGADENEHRICRHRFALAALIVLDCYRLEIVGATNGGNFSVQFDCNVLCFIDLVDQILGHALL